MSIKIFSGLQFLIIFCFIFEIKSYNFQNVHFLISAQLNGTSPVISLNQINPKSNYINFIFDFSYHSKNVQDSKNVAYFKISTNLDIPTDDESNPYLITYKFFEDDWTKIEKMRVAKKLTYKNVKIISKENNSDDNIKYTYYFKIERQNDKDNSLMIKVPTQNKKEGFISVENILNLNSNNLEKN